MQLDQLPGSSGLMAASEATLGVFSEITLKLIPPPQTSKAMMAVYQTIEGATETVAAIIAGKILPCTLKFLDKPTIQAVKAFARVGLPVEAEALLLIEVEGHPGQVEERQSPFFPGPRRQQNLSAYR